MSEHTPGPWKIGTPPGDGRGVCHSIYRPCSSSGEWKRIATHVHGEANARLIAAAPDLLDLISQVVDEWDASEIGQLDGAVIDSARASLAKARGGTP